MALKCSSVQAEIGGGDGAQPPAREICSDQQYEIIFDLVVENVHFVFVIVDFRQGILLVVILEILLENRGIV